jgi:hypothetical protein
LNFLLNEQALHHVQIKQEFAVDNSSTSSTSESDSAGFGESPTTSIGHNDDDDADDAPSFHALRFSEDFKQMQQNQDEQGQSPPQAGF